MTRLRDHVAARCPASEADARLQKYFAANREADEGARLRLRAPLRGGPQLPNVDLSRDVIVTITRGRDDENINDVLRIHWEPADGGPFPTFDGTLVTWGEDKPETQSFIELDGNYEPPFGAAGAAFDAAIGHEIARRTAHALLRDLADAISTTGA